MGARADTNVEYRAIIDMLAELGRDQKTYNARREELKSIKTKGKFLSLVFFSFH